MALPSRRAQIERIAKFLDADHTEGRELAEIAADIVDAFADMYGKEFKDPPLVPHVGMAFKHPAISGVWHVAYHDPSADRFWIVSTGTKFGGWLKAGSDFWSYATPSGAKAGAPNNNPHWAVGDLASRGQRRAQFRIAATGDKCVLLGDPAGNLQAESNDNMKLYYRRERVAHEEEW